MKRLFSVALILVVSLAAPVQGQEPIQDRLFIPAPVLLESPVLVPAGLDPETSATLVIGLHGGGSSPASFLGLWEGIPSVDFLYLALQGPYPVSGSPEPAFDWAMWPKADPVLMRRAGDLLPRYVSAAITEMRKRFNIDRVYLLGFSQGAIYSYVVGMGMPDQLEGLVIFSGPGLESPINSPFTVEPALPMWIERSHIEKASTLRIFLAHGRADPAAEFTLAEESRDVLLGNGYDVTFRPFDGGHEIPPTAILAEVAKWISAR